VNVIANLVEKVIAKIAIAKIVSAKDANAKKQMKTKKECLEE
jgi:hypothetical protein